MNKETIPTSESNEKLPQYKGLLRQFVIARAIYDTQYERGVGVVKDSLKILGELEGSPAKEHFTGVREELDSMYAGGVSPKEAIKGRRIEKVIEQIVWWELYDAMFQVGAKLDPEDRHRINEEVIEDLKNEYGKNVAATVLSAELEIRRERLGGDSQEFHDLNRELFDIFLKGGKSPGNDPEVAEKVSRLKELGAKIRKESPGLQHSGLGGDYYDAVTYWEELAVQRDAAVAELNRIRLGIVEREQLAIIEKIDQDMKKRGMTPEPFEEKKPLPRAEV